MPWKVSEVSDGLQGVPYIKDILEWEKRDFFVPEYSIQIWAKLNYITIEIYFKN